MFRAKGLGSRALGLVLRVSGLIPESCKRFWTPLPGINMVLKANQEIELPYLNLPCESDCSQ